MNAVKGWKTVIFGLAVIVVPSALTYLGNIDWTTLGISPAAVERKIRNVTLSDQQYDDYARIAGGMAKMRLDKIVAYPGFATWPASIRADVINTAISQSRETARGVVLMKFPQLISDAYNLKLQAIRGPRKPIQ